MDRRHGKRPLSPHQPEEKEEDRADPDMTAMVSALTQVIGTTQEGAPGAHPGISRRNPNPPVAVAPPAAQPEEQGIGCYHRFIYHL